ncbi:MAG: proline--tRNA ligase [Candidatus Diapherotrites archaeon]|nr:proline--tRNA ligase [Candidatus Diapherotrites archaeon]
MEEKRSLLGITEKKEDNFSEWYNQIVLKAELADYAPVRGCMVIRPNGYAIWQNIQNYFNKVLEERGVKNAYFPLLIPESFFKREAQHAAGFAPELAWIERKSEDSEERLAIRPTSETIMYDSYSKWIRSHRDLPLRINQWCNILRWEVSQTKLFLRTREFLWQEGHCAYSTEEECVKEALTFLEEYRKLCEDILAIPVIKGEKTAKERFSGAKQTFTIEAFMPDGKALQMGTSHNLGQNFAKSFGIEFLDDKGNRQFAWQNSWGFSTRLIGALVMTHSDNKGLIMPPKVAYAQIVIVPILFEDSKHKVLKESKKICEKLNKNGLICFVDERENVSVGWKFNEWELKGIPLRIEIGPKDLTSKKVILVRRDTFDKKAVEIRSVVKECKKTLDKIQEELFARAKRFLDSSIVEVRTWVEFKNAIENKKLVFAYFCESKECEEEIKRETTATSRCIPFDQKNKEGVCVKCGSVAKRKVYFAKSY